MRPEGTRVWHRNRHKAWRGIPAGRKAARQAPAARAAQEPRMRGDDTTIHPPQTGVWPGGEPGSVRGRADELARTRRDRVAATRAEENMRFVREKVMARFPGLAQELGGVIGERSRTECLAPVRPGRGRH